MPLPLSFLHEAVRSSKGLVFDLFHTLTARESTWPDRVMTNQILGVTREQWDAQHNETSRFRLAGEERDPFQIVARMARAINPEIDDATITKATENRLARFAQAVRQIPEQNLKALEALKARGKKLGLVSNADAMEIAAWNDSPLKDLFDSVVISCEVGHVKPEPEIFQRCLADLNLKAKDCLFVGDGGSNELAATAKLGFGTVLVTGVIRELWPDLIAPRMKDAHFMVEEPMELLPTFLPEVAKIL